VSGWLDEIEWGASFFDVMLPDGSGLEICRDIRAENSHVSIILLTALKEEVDRIIGLEIGADDYLGKPFNPRELAARMTLQFETRQRDLTPVLRRPVEPAWRERTEARRRSGPKCARSRHPFAYSITTSATRHGSDGRFATRRDH
jgi:DNA-binding response OmpR family regulator